MTKFATYQSSSSTPAAELVGRGVRTLDRFVGDGFDALLESQQTELGRFWDRADVRVVAQEDSERTQQAIRWNLFQVAQATWRAERAGVPAKGLTGPAYDGHLLLGHRDVRAPDAVLHVATDRTQPAALPPQHTAQGA